MTSDVEHFRQAQESRLADLRILVANKPAHDRFLRELEDAGPSEVLDDIEPPRGVSRKVADALIADIEWIAAQAPEPGASIAPYPNAYRALRIDQARANAQRKRTRADNELWSGLTFEKDI